MKSVHSLDTGRIEDIHGHLDEAISKGAKGAILIAIYPDGTGEDGDWEAWATDGLCGKERLFAYQQLSFLELTIPMGHPEEEPNDG